MSIEMKNMSPKSPSTSRIIMMRCGMLSLAMMICLLQWEFQFASSFTVTVTNRNHQRTNRRIQQGPFLPRDSIARDHDTNSHINNHSSPILMRAAYVSTEEDVQTNNKGRFRRWRGRRNREEKGSSSAIQMKFIGKKHVVTPPIVATDAGMHMDSNDVNGDIDMGVYPVLLELLNGYFSKDEHRNLLFPKNNAINYNGPITRELIDTWCQEAERGGATGPEYIEHNDGTISLCNTGMCSSSGTSSGAENQMQRQQIMQISTILEMPSLQIKSESTIGVKLIMGESGSGSGSHDHPFPEFQFTLLESQLIPEGSAPAMWVFNQLIKFRDLTSSFTRVTVEDASMSSSASSKEDGDTRNMIVFVTDARLETRIHIPSAIMKLLPSSIDVSKFEKSGSESIQKLLEKELEPALMGFRDAFQSYAAENERACGTSSRSNSANFRKEEMGVLI